jgi:hypothetical protein
MRFGHAIDGERLRENGLTPDSQQRQSCARGTSTCKPFRSASADRSHLAHKHLDECGAY